MLVGCPGSASDTDTDTGDTAEPIVPGTETVSPSWDVDLFSLYESPTIPRFDTLEGRRRLDGMTIAVDHAAVMTVTVENGTDIALADDDYSAELYFQSLIQLGLEEPPEEGEEGPPFFGPGAFLAVVAGDDDGHLPVFGCRGLTAETPVRRASHARMRQRRSCRRLNAGACSVAASVSCQSARAFAWSPVAFAAFPAL